MLPKQIAQQVEMVHETILKRFEGQCKNVEFIQLKNDEVCFSFSIPF